jgi:hypothetical protein
MVVQLSFWHVFGLSVESVEAQPVYGHQRGESEEDATIYFFDGYIFNIPFCKIMIGTVYGLADD